MWQYNALDGNLLAYIVYCMHIAYASTGIFQREKNILRGEFEINGPGTNKGADYKNRTAKISIFQYVLRC